MILSNFKYILGVYYVAKLDSASIVFTMSVRLSVYEHDSDQTKFLQTWRVSSLHQVKEPYWFWGLEGWGDPGSVDPWESFGGSVGRTDNRKYKSYKVHVGT